MGGISAGAGRHPGHGGQAGGGLRGPSPGGWLGAVGGRSVCCDQPVDGRLRMPELLSQSGSVGPGGSSVFVC